jgi:hypothetical protein
MTKDLTAQQILQLPLGENDAEAATIGHFLAALTEKVLDEGDQFSG